MFILGQIPEGYTDMSTPKPEGGGKRKIKIQAPNGRTFSTIKKAQEYYMKSMQTKGIYSSYFETSCNVM